MKTPGDFAILILELLWDICCILVSLALHAIYALFSLLFRGEERKLDSTSSPSSSPAKGSKPLQTKREGDDEEKDREPSVPSKSASNGHCNVAKNLPEPLTAQNAVDPAPMTAEERARMRKTRLAALEKTKPQPKQGKHKNKNRPLRGPHSQYEMRWQCG